MSQSFCQAGLYYSMTQPVRPNADVSTRPGITLTQCRRQMFQAQNRGNASRYFVLAVSKPILATLYIGRVFIFHHIISSLCPRLSHVRLLSSLLGQLLSTHDLEV